MILKNLYIRSTTPYLFRIENLHYLVNLGASIILEEGHPFSSQEIQSLRAKEELQGRWIDQPHETIIVGSKEIEEGPEPLTQRHVCFSSLFNEAISKSNIMQRFFWGNGRLFDLSFLTDFSEDNLSQHTTQDHITQEIALYIQNRPSENWLQSEQAFINIVTNYTPS